MAEDCTFIYFKPGGKYAYEGRGVFPPYPGEGWQEINREAIRAANGGMPGVIGLAEDLLVVVIPDEDCTHPFAYPRFLLASR